MQAQHITHRMTLAQAVAEAVERGEVETQAHADLLALIKTGQVAGFSVNGVPHVAPRKARHDQDGDS